MATTYYTVLKEDTVSKVQTFLFITESKTMAEFATDNVKALTDTECYRVLVLAPGGGNSVVNPDGTIELRSIDRTPGNAMLPRWERALISAATPYSKPVLQD